MTEAQRANGFVPGQPVAAEHLNYEIQRLTADVEAAALCNILAQTSGTVLDLNCVFWHEQTEQFLTAGSGGHLRTSPDGRVWTAQTSGVATDIVGIGGNDSTLVYVGASGVIRTSPDGITWTSRTSGTAATLTGVAWFAAASIFIAVGLGGVLLTSPDGITWTPRTSGTIVDLLAVACNDTTAVAVGGDGFTTPVCTSLDGITWTFQDLPFGVAAGVAWSDPIGLFAIAAFNLLYTSPDGIIWTERTNPTSANVNGMATSQRHFFGCGDNMLISRDGITWHVADSTENSVQPVDGAWNGRVMVVVGPGGAIHKTHRVPPAF